MNTPTQNMELAAIRLAAIIDVQDRIDRDPNWRADRTPEAEAGRARMRDQYLDEYRAACQAMTA